jgi:branched-chain amino acid transport system ATP-binding protein
MLTVKNLKKSFGGLQALKGVDIALPDQSILGVIGMNGSGKTTLLNCVNGIYIPDEGDVILDGVNLVGIPVHKIAGFGIGRTFQVPRVFQHLTLLENLDVAQVASQAGSNERYALAEFWLKQVELLSLRHNYAEELSGGQQKLLELARLMVAKPRVILLDEPFAGVNPELAQMLIDIIRDIPTKHNCAVILVSHDLTSIYQLSNHIIVMNEGAILTQGDAAVVKSDPAVIEAYLGA